MRSIKTWSLILGMLCLSATGFAQVKPAGEGVRSELLVSTQWLAEHLKDPKVVVLHVADNALDFKRGHIPGARFLDQNKFTENAGDLNTELPSPEKLQKLFADLGVGDNTRVVIYATNWMPNAARAFLTLDYIGHQNHALLDGGIEQWLSEDRPVSGEAPKITPATLSIKPNESVRVRLEQVQSVVDGKDAEAQIVDARPARRYTAGHLSGATNIYWEDTLVSKENPVFQSPEKLRALYASRGMVPGKKVVTYCEIGMQASHGYFLARYLGYDAAMYDGSYQEWGAKKLPTVKGEAKTEPPKAEPTK
jgi:thiosulfate/3-mercaptopyruvate sulfurtransferase